ncbi:MAG: hypothetical protein ABI234_15505 [Ktedonobacteraceae bacterium]
MTDIRNPNGVSFAYGRAEVRERPLQAIHPALTGKPYTGIAIVRRACRSKAAPYYSIRWRGQQFSRGAFNDE